MIHQSFLKKVIQLKKSGIGLYNFLNIIHNYDNAIYSVTLDNNEFIIRITIS